MVFVAFLQDQPLRAFIAIAAQRRPFAGIIGLATQRLAPRLGAEQVRNVVSVGLLSFFWDTFRPLFLCRRIIGIVVVKSVRYC
jgi:hypothetical protein